MVTQRLATSILASALVMVSALGHSAQAEQVYRWVDDEGVTHFTAHPPQNRPAEALRPKTGHSEPVDYSQRFPTPDDHPLSSDRDSQPEGEPSQPENQQQACSQARENLTILERGGRIAVQDDNGEPRFLNQEEVSERTATARQLIAENC
ncbi:DUF4124 domain-containing protein [Marinimicrobium sp. ARAG 43.8]|uniref:DUF4124 domain-containing protein n=1 Tax=Marinimicrobium sp. ARAG 43.8 TaxID=3418719 RepID=UPI003CF1DB55